MQCRPQPARAQRGYGREQGAGPWVGRTSSASPRLRRERSRCACALPRHEPAGTSAMVASTECGPGEWLPIGDPDGLTDSDKKRSSAARTRTLTNASKGRCAANYTTAERAGKRSESLRSTRRLTQGPHGYPSRNVACRVLESYGCVSYGD